MIKQATRKITPDGFSITGAVIAVALTFLAANITAALFKYTIQNIGRVEKEQKQNNLIDSDIAKIYRFNQQFSCTDPSSSCSLSDSYPDEDGYIPDDYSEAGSATPGWLKAQCSDGFGDDLVELINNEPATGLGIVRTAERSNASDSPHEYTVKWLEDGVLRKEIRLTPTVASWC